MPAGAPDDGVERGIAAFIGCSSLIRQFEFAMNVWVNDPKFKDLDNERDPIIGRQEEGATFTIPKQPVRRRVHGIQTFNVLKGGEYFFVPSMSALKWLANLE